MIMVKPDQAWILLKNWKSTFQVLIDEVTVHQSPIQDSGNWIKVGQCKLVVHRLIDSVVKLGVELF